jgi:hypothetical protein
MGSLCAFSPHSGKPRSVRMLRARRRSETPASRGRREPGSEPNGPPVEHDSGPAGIPRAYGLTVGLARARCQQWRARTGLDVRSGSAPGRRTAAQRALARRGDASVPFGPEGTRPEFANGRWHDRNAVNPPACVIRAAQPCPVMAWSGRWGSNPRPHVLPHSRARCRRDPSATDG